MARRNFMWLRILVLSAFLLIGCKGTDLSEGISITSGNGTGGSTLPNIDNTAPVLTGTIAHSNDSAVDRSATAVWPSATDDEAVSFYEFSISLDNGNSSCASDDFGTPVLDWTRVPSGADFSGAGYQVVHGGNDGSNQVINLNLNGDNNYCMAVRAVDSSNNVSDAIYSSSVFNFLYASCLEALNNEPGLNDGVYNIDPDGVAGEPSYAAFCDMTTQGGGWTLVMRYDASLANAGAYFMPAGSARSQMNINDIQGINTTGNVTASANFIPFIQNGATMLMHVGKPNDAATDSSTYARVYFSDIYQAVIDTPSNIFNPALDTNSGGGVSGVVVNGFDPVRRDRWYESDMSEMTVEDTDGNTANTYRIDGGEGAAMFTNGNREGAVYACGNTSNAEGHGDPKIQWGFAGADGSTQTYGGTTYIGTHCSSGLSCAPENPINMMFIR